MEIKKWLGLRNTDSPERLKPGELSVAQNVDISNADALLARTGYMTVQNGSYHSLWASDRTCYVMVGNDMKRLLEDGSLVQIKRLTSGRKVSFAEQNGVVYFTNRSDSGRIVNGTALEWGIRNPVSQPKADPYVGTLPAGRYLYAMTFVRSDGLESGTGVAGAIELTQSGGILFSSLETSTNPEVSGKIMYLSTANGTQLYRAAVLPAVAASYAYMNGGVDLTVTLDTQFVEPAPKGHIVEFHSGIAYVVDGNVCWYSDPYSVERFRRAEFKFLQFPGHVSLFGSVGDGIYVGTEKGTWFLQGNEPSSLQSRQVLSYGAIEGTAVKFDSELMNEEGEATGITRPSLMWTSPYGIMVGLSNGQVRNLTEQKYGFPSAQQGAAAIRATKGFTQYVSTLQGTGQTPNTYE